MLNLFLNLFKEPWLFLAIGLAFGIIAALFVSSEKDELIKQTSTHWSKILLQAAIVLLGASLHLNTVIDTGLSTLLPNVIQIFSILALAFFASKMFSLNRQVAFLLAVGTAICGGSAIAAVGPLLMVTSSEMGLSLSVIFLLNAVALFVFPPLGQLLKMNQQQFGMWSALSIHDTSSVVGAAAQYGEQALTIATTQKLTRALWMIPVALGVSFYNKKKGRQTKAKLKKPWFILYFLIMSFLFSYIPFLQTMQNDFAQLGRMLLCLAILLIGSSLDLNAIRKVGMKMLIFGMLLWLISLLLGYAIAMSFAT